MKRSMILSLLFCLGILCGVACPQSTASSRMVALNGSTFAFVNLDGSGNILTATGETATPVTSTDYAAPVALMALNPASGKFEFAHIDSNGNLLVSGGGGGSSITLKVNGTNNGSQSILNLKNGTNMTIVDDGSGGITVSTPAQTFPSAGIMVSGGAGFGTSLAAPVGAIVGLTDTQALTNKTLDGVTPAIMAFLDATSSIQTQINSKQATLTLPLSVANGGTGAATCPANSVFGNFTASIAAPGCSATPIFSLASLTGNISGSAASLTTTRTIGGNNFNGTANTPLVNKFIVQGTVDAGLTGAQFLGALSTGILCNTTTTGVLSICSTFQTNAVSNSSQNLLNFVTSTVNAIGLTATPVNSAGTEKFEITGVAATATNIAGGVIGSVPYQTAANTTSLLAGNTAATDKVYVSHGSGAAALAPTMTNAPAISPANFVGAGTAIEETFTGAQTVNYVHNLGTLNPLVNCYINSGNTTYSISVVDLNTVAVTSGGTADTTCAFGYVPTLVVAPNFSFVETPTSSAILVPGLTTTNTTPFSIAQSVVGGFASVVNYSTTSLPSGLSSAFSPTSITGAGSSTLTITYPWNQASGANNFTTSATGGSTTHTQATTLNLSTTSNGLVLGLPMNEGSGSTLHDITATTNFTNTAVTWVASSGFPGLPANYNGTTSESVGANTTSTVFIDGSNAFSVSAWVNFADVSTNQHNIDCNLDATVKGWCFYEFSGELNLQLINSVSPSVNAIVVHSPATLLATSLHHVAVVYSGGRLAANAILYIDGVSQTPTVDFDQLSATIANTQPILIGAAPFTPFNFMNGVIGYNRIYNRALTQAEITALFNAGPK